MWSELGKSSSSLVDTTHDLTAASASEVQLLLCSQMPQTRMKLFQHCKMVCFHPNSQIIFQENKTEHALQSYAEVKGLQN